MKTGSPRVSIGMPVYNEERFVGPAIESLLAQTWTDFELIVSDNGSTDRTPEICAGYASDDPRVQFVRHATNRGAAWNFPHVLSLAKGEYFMWAGSHDLWAPEYVARCVAMLDEHPNAGLAYAGSAMIDGNGRVTMPRVPEPSCLEGKAPLERAVILMRELSICNMVYGLHRTTVLNACRTDLNCIDLDRVLLMEIALRAEIVRICDVLFYARDRGPYTDYHQSRAAQLARLRAPGGERCGEWLHWRLLYEHVVGACRSPGSLLQRVRRAVTVALVGCRRYQWGMCSEWRLGGWILAQFLKMVRVGGTLRRDTRSRVGREGS